VVSKAGRRQSSGEAKLRERRGEFKKYHRFVNTTPKPRATKKSSGLLVGPLPPPGSARCVGVSVGTPMGVAGGTDMMYRW
jgi:hypothetical protein